MKFVEILGNASTTVFLNGRKIGHNVNVSLYSQKGSFILRLESNGVKVRGVDNIRMTHDEYESWVDEKPIGKSMLIYSLDLFNCKTFWSN